MLHGNAYDFREVSILQNSKQCWNLLCTSVSEENMYVCHFPWLLLCASDITSVFATSLHVKFKIVLLHVKLTAHPQLLSLGTLLELCAPVHFFCPDHVFCSSAISFMVSHSPGSMAHHEYEVVTYLGHKECNNLQLVLVLWITNLCLDWSVINKMQMKLNCVTSFMWQ